MSPVTSEGLCNYSNCSQSAGPVLPLMSLGPWSWPIPWCLIFVLVCFGHVKKRGKATMAVPRAVDILRSNCVCPQKPFEKWMVPSGRTCTHSCHMPPFHHLQRSVFYSWPFYLNTRKAEKTQWDSSLLWSRVEPSQDPKSKAHQQGGCESHAMLGEASNLTMVVAFGISTKIGQCFVIPEFVSG